MPNIRSEAFAPLQEELERLADVAWDGYDSYRKPPSSGCAEGS